MQSVLTRLDNLFNDRSSCIYSISFQLVSLYELRPPISKKKIVDITKAAMKAIKYYKHVVFGVEKFLTKCKSEYKVPGLYCIDSIIRQSKHQFKDKDVFGPRFALNMLTTLSNVLNCKPDDKLKIVRVLNLWKSHEIFEAARLRPWLEFCRDIHGLEIDVAVVEKSVKGDQADFSIYNRIPGRSEKRKMEVSTFSSVCDIRSRTPPLPSIKSSGDIVEGGLSERETLEMLTTMGLDLGGIFTSDPSLLQKVCKLVNDKLTERRELDSKRQGNIKTLLSKEFDYSDDEDSGDDDFNRKLEAETKLTELTKQQIMGMAEAVLREPDTKEEIQRMHTERISALSQAAAVRVQAVKQQQQLQHQGNIPPVSNKLGSQLGASPITIPLNPISSSQSNVVTIPPLSILMPGQSLQPQVSKNVLSPRSAQQLLFNTGGLAPFAPNMHPPSLMSIVPSHISTSLPAPLANATNSISRDRSNIDQDDRYQRIDTDRFDGDRDERPGRTQGRTDRMDEKLDKDQERRRGRSRDHEHERDRTSNRGFADVHLSKRVRRSRSRDHSYGDRRREHHRSGSHGHRGTSRTRIEKERSERDHNNSSYRDLERYRRKMGLPWPPKEGYLLIASCTLWLGRIPSNCTENDIRQAITDGGEPSRISIIHSRACAYVTMKDRKEAYRVMDRMQKNFKIREKCVKLNWGIGQGLKRDKYAEYWDAERGYSLIPHNMLPDDLETLIEGGHLEVESLPVHLANLYDEHGLKAKRIDTEPASSQSTSNIQLPQMVPNFSSYQFPVNHPPRIPGTAPFLPPGMMPIPGIFPPALPPHIGGGVKPVGSGPKSQDYSKGETLASSASPAPRQVFLIKNISLLLGFFQLQVINILFQATDNMMNLEGIRLPDELICLLPLTICIKFSGPNSFMTNYNVPPPRYNASCASVGLRTNRPGVFPGRPPFAPFGGGPSFAGSPIRGALHTPTPPMHHPAGMGRGPRNHYPPRHFAPTVQSSNSDAYNATQDDRWRSNEFDDMYVENSREDEWNHNGIALPSNEEYKYGENIHKEINNTSLEKMTAQRPMIDDSSNELVTSTTHDDENPEFKDILQPSVHEIKKPGFEMEAQNTDDLKVILYNFFQ
ncbi:unnamed protein product [Thelazia callipaeda]|uniref:CID domain-containing protein n=1 Tax=Thelazia callipaeda TaxID=103827 RepID=A0A0N5CLA5_THECL|nr:unnamed protein product [Thelazia callipaeda]